MSGGEVRALRREGGQESPRMPAWKREILERRKAKGGGGGTGACAAEPSSSAAAARLNGDASGDSSSGASKNKESASSAGAHRKYTITPASQHYAAGRHGSASASPDLSPVKSNKDPWIANDTVDAEKSSSGGRVGEGESLVLQDSLGPLQENPFIKLEKERKRQQDRESAARPVQHILELYGSVPGVRTIRAENIIIIESDSDYFSDVKSGARLQQNGTVGSYSSLSDLIDRRGGGVTEIRAKEVVLYDSALSKSEENLSTLGRPGSEEQLDPGQSQGRVSRMLRKFDRNYGKLQPKSRSTENLLDLETGPARPWARPRTQPVYQVPKSTLYRSPAVVTDRAEPGSVFQSSPSSKPHSDASPEGRSSNGSSPGSPAGSPQSVSSYRRHFEKGAADRGEFPERFRPRPARPQDWPSGGLSSSSPERRCRAAAAGPSPSPPPSPPSPRFEIRPSPRPDLSALPAGDIQARALANLRLQSRNSFTVIPRRRRAAGGVASPGSTAPSSPVLSPTPPPAATQSASNEPPASAVPTPAPVASPPTPPTAKKQGRGSAAGPAKTEPSEPDGPPVPAPPLPPPESPLDPPEASAATSDLLPVTNIDDVELGAGLGAGLPGPGAVVQRRSGNTFTVVPKRKAAPPEPRDAGPQAPSLPTQAPYTQLGSLLKKRYPAVDEIEVIGGYLSPGRSCLSKPSSGGKKLNISFNESALSSTYEYPSESSFWDSEDEERDGEEEEDAQWGEEEKEEKGGRRMLIPRVSYTPTDSTNGSDLSSYIPKNSVDFSAWQEHKLEQPSFPGDPSSQGTQSPEEVMLTPADSSSLSDFSSEPALYF